MAIGVAFLRAVSADPCVGHDERRFVRNRASGVQRLLDRREVVAVNLLDVANPNATNAVADAFRQR